MKHNFLLCGSVGLCLEVFWTGLHSLIRGEATMTGQTSLLMFPIYGCAALIKPVYQKNSSLPAVLRGCIYTAGIYFAEFFSGSVLKPFGICPWDYSETPLKIKGIIRLDYAPLWFLTGLLFEKILTKPS